MAKDLIIVSGKTDFSYQDVDGYFRDRVFLNFLNEIVTTEQENFEEMMRSEIGISDAWFGDNVPSHMRNHSHLMRAKRNQRWFKASAALDNIFTQYAEQAQHNTSFLYKENLYNTSDFSLKYYKPILKNVSIDQFRTPGDDHLIYEMSYDPEMKFSRPVNRLIRRNYN